MENVHASNYNPGGDDIQSEVSGSKEKMDSSFEKSGAQIKVGLAEAPSFISVKIQCPHQAADAYTVTEADPKDVEDHKLLIKISDAIITWEEVTTLGIWLHCNPNDVARLKGDGFTIKGAAYDILRSFYTRGSANDDKAQMLKDALKELNKEATFADVKLNF